MFKYSVLQTHFWNIKYAYMPNWQLSLAVLVNFGVYLL